MKKVQRVRIIVLKDFKVLLLKKQNKKNYTFPGGVVKKHESLKEALIREVKEEIGAAVLEDQLKYLGAISKVKKGKEFSSTYFLLTDPSNYSYELIETYKFSELSWNNILKASNNLKNHDKYIVDDIILKNYHNSFNDFTQF